MNPAARSGRLCLAFGSALAVFVVPACAGHAQRSSTGVAPQRAGVPARPDGAAVDDACAPPALLCDGFEEHTSGRPPSAPWRDETGTSGAQVRVDASRAFRGRHSVHVLAPKGAAYRRGYFAIHGSPVFPAAALEMFGRAMLYLDAAPVTRPGAPLVHWTMVQGEGRSRDDTFNSLYRYGGQHQGGLGLMANFETTPPVASDCWQHSASRMPVQRWVCIEWHFAVATNEMQFWLEGNEIADLHVTERAAGAESGCLATDALGGQWLAPPAFQSLYLGWERYQEPENDQHVWIDDVVLSKSRVGCPPAVARP